MNGAPHAQEYIINAIVKNLTYVNICKSHDSSTKLHYYTLIFSNLHRTMSRIEAEDTPIELVALQVYVPLSTRSNTDMVSVVEVLVDWIMK